MLALAKKEEINGSKKKKSKKVASGRIKSEKDNFMSDPSGKTTDEGLLRE